MLIVIWLMESICFVVVFSALLAVGWFDERRLGHGPSHPPRG
jgi:hypothetical protein